MHYVMHITVIVTPEVDREGKALSFARSGGAFSCALGHLSHFLHSCYARVAASTEPVVARTLPAAEYGRATSVITTEAAVLAAHTCLLIPRGAVVIEPSESAAIFKYKLGILQSKKKARQQIFDNLAKNFYLLGDNPFSFSSSS